MTVDATTRYPETLAEYERRNSGTIVEHYIVPTENAGAVLMSHPRRFGRPWYSIGVAYDVAKASPSIGELLRRIRFMELQSAAQLDRRAHQILVQSLFGLATCLLSTHSSADAGQSSADAQSRRISSVVKSVDRELAALSRFVQSSARQTALGLYLAGLPIGAVIGCLLVVLSGYSLTIGSLIGEKQLPICLASGAIGAVISVMARITRGERLDVDFGKGKIVTVLAGTFRPVIGAVFGGVLYVLIHGGILPLSMPGPDKVKVCLFFAGLAFLAGFTERWAQDTIVSSTPKVK
jgi:hypothetical protein